MKTEQDLKNKAEICYLCLQLRALSTRTALVALIVADLLILFVLFPAIGGAAEVVPLDLRFWYTPDTVYSTFQALGADGRIRYAISALTLDLLYPLVYSSMFAVWMTRSIAVDTRLNCALRLLPLAVLVADLLENLSIVVMLSRFPARLESLASAAAMFTATKWLLAFAVVLSALLLTFRAGWRWLRRQPDAD